MSSLIYAIHKCAEEDTCKLCKTIHIERRCPPPPSDSYNIMNGTTNLLIV